jgi:hypothetical protein
VVKMGRYVSAFAAVTALAGCGGSGKKVTVTTRAVLPSTTATATSSPNAIPLPASAAGPTTCTVYEAGYATQVIFVSRSLDVRGECRAWTRNKAGEGYLWGYQPASALAESAEATEVCRLTDPHGDVAASVIEATGFRSLSAVEGANGSAACVSLLATGWIEQRGTSRTGRRSTAKP